jgi:predicted neuraminidase
MCRDLNQPFRAWESVNAAAWQRSSLDELPQLDDELPTLSTATNG